MIRLNLVKFEVEFDTALEAVQFWMEYMKCINPAYEETRKQLEEEQRRKEYATKGAA